VARGLLVPGGLLITIAVTMAPLFVYGVQHALGWVDAPGAIGATLRVLQDGQGQLGAG
jgi:hypothetical protein